MRKSTLSLNILSLVFGCLLFSTNTGHTQNIQTSNQFIVGIVDQHSGLRSVLIPPGRIFHDAQLSFADKSFFTCQIGADFFTNNEVVEPLPPTAKRLTDGTTTKTADTIRTIWADKDGVDIIQDIYPVALGNGGQIVTKWSFKNNNGTSVAIGCQYLNDLQITDPADLQMPNSNDGPVLVIANTYDPIWQQFSINSNDIPQSYTGFLHTLPNAPSFNPGLMAKGYIDFGAPLNLIKPSRVTVGAWYDMTQTIFGPATAWPYHNAYGTQGQSDNAVLVEFQQVAVAPGATVEIGRTSYGTDIGDSAVGNSAGEVFYPHQFVADKSSKQFLPKHVEFFANPFGVSHTQTLTAGTLLNIVGPPPEYKMIGKTQTITATGINPYFSWYVSPDSGFTCTADIISSVKFSGQDGTFEYPVVIPCQTSASVPNSSSNIALSIGQNRPNPFSQTTTFNYSICESGLVRLYLYDELGKEVSRIIDNAKAKGVYAVDFDGSKLPTGSYTLRLENGGTVVSRKVIIDR